MVNFISIMIAFLITLPFLPTLLVYKISKKVVQHKLRALHLAINWTTILYILATITMLNNIFEQQYTGIVIGLILFFLVIIIIWQWKTKTEIIFSRAIKILWRLCFLVFLFAYAILAVYGIMIRIIL